jgi:uncharacterized membrane protein YfhO
MPMVTAGQQPKFASEEETMAALGSSDFNPRTTVYLPREAANLVTATNTASAKVELKGYSPQSLAISVESPQPAMVVVAQTYYHPWHAYVDGRGMTLWRANHAFQALEVPAGKHEVKLVYEDRPFRVGAMISLVSLAVCVTAWRGRSKAGAEGIITAGPVGG